MKVLVSVLLVSVGLPSQLRAEICLVPAEAGENVTVDCDPLEPTVVSNAVVGYARSGAGCRVGDCHPFGKPYEVGYGWSISASSTDPGINTGELASPEGEVFLWLECALDDGFTAARFDVEITAPDLRLLSATLLNGTLNAGSGSELVLAVGGCPVWPFLAAKLTVAVDEPDSVEPTTWGRVKGMYR